MSRVGRTVVAGVGIVAIVAAMAFGAAWVTPDGAASAQSGKAGPWHAIIPLSICEDVCDMANTAPPDMQDMANFAKLSPAGDPNGSPSVAINVIAKLEQDGCEWQWQPQGERVVILYRC